MARHEEDREDLIREATALVERVELEVPGYEDPVVAGFRRDGCASFFFGPNLVLQFNSRGQLRRGYDAGRLFKADQGRLVRMDRERGEREVVLRSRPMTALEASETVALAESYLAGLLAALVRSAHRVLRLAPPQAPLVDRVRAWLEAHAARIAIASRPNVD